jgi:hypothetical protein
MEVKAEKYVGRMLFDTWPNSASAAKRESGRYASPACIAPSLSCSFSDISIFPFHPNFTPSYILPTLHKH